MFEIFVKMALISLVVVMALKFLIEVKAMRSEAAQLTYGFIGLLSVMVMIVSTIGAILTF